MAESAEPAEDTEETPKAKLGMVQILLIVVLVIVTQVIMKVVLDTFFPPQVVAENAEDGEAEADQEEVPVEELEPANYLPLDPALVVNIQDEGKSQYLQTSIQLMTRNAEVHEAAKLHAPAIRSALILLFSTVPYDSLSTVEGKEQLRESARVRIDEVLMELAGVEGVEAVYLTSMVFQ
jgi:flagellar FliL protein